MATDKNTIGFNRIVDDLTSLGLKKGDLVNVKASLKSIGFVEGGIKTLLDALLEVVGEEGTIVTESFVKTYTNKSEARKNIVSAETPSYAGALANEILRHPKVFRSTHPVQKFAAIGAKAELLMKNHTVDSRPYDVLREMIFSGGKNIRIGGLDKVVGVGTTHVAVDYLKLQQKRNPTYVYYQHNGSLHCFKPDWVNGCEKLFNNLIEIFDKKDAILSRGKVGNAESMLTEMKQTYDIEIDLITNNLDSFNCGEPSCIYCNVGWKHTPTKLVGTMASLIKEGKYGLAYRAFEMRFINDYQPNSKRSNC
jgi:aminoglycoside N3'-acetyltransferase